ncbi:zinc-ribbon domain-containing protein [Guptibacillus hwajinpoensis]|nr:zinc-ribbon domain-containing protein [Pseudalkalibacillus hwajinpoensis]
MQLVKGAKRVDHCTNCGKKLEEKREFCTGCGQPVQQVKEVMTPTGETSP